MSRPPRRLFHVHRWVDIEAVYEQIVRIVTDYEGPYGDGSVSREMVVTFKIQSCRCGWDRHLEIARESTASRRARL